MQSISSQLEEMFRSRSRAELSESLAAIIMEALIAPTLIPERLIMEQVMLLAILHGNVGSEVGKDTDSVPQQFKISYSRCKFILTYQTGRFDIISSVQQEPLTRRH